MAGRAALRPALLSIGVAAALLHGPPPLRAADAVPEDGRTCFCLEHRVTEQLLRGCTGRRGPNDFHVTATCADAEPGAARRRLTVTPEWSVVSGGQGRCVPAPCGLQAEGRTTRDLPRGEDGR